MGGSEAAPTPEEGLASAETRRAVQAALATMPADEREVIVLAYSDELTQSEIAERLGMAARHGEDEDPSGAGPAARGPRG